MRERGEGGRTTKISAQAPTTADALLVLHDASAVSISTPSERTVDVHVLSDASMPAWPLSEPDVELEPMPPPDECDDELTAEWLAAAAPDLCGVGLAVEEGEADMCEPDEPLCVADAAAPLLLEPWAPEVLLLDLCGLDAAADECLAELDDLWPEVDDEDECEPCADPTPLPDDASPAELEASWCAADDEPCPPFEPDVDEAAPVLVPADEPSQAHPLPPVEAPALAPAPRPKPPPSPAPSRPNVRLSSAREASSARREGALSASAEEERERRATRASERRMTSREEEVARQRVRRGGRGVRDCGGRGVRTRRSEGKREERRTSLDARSCTRPHSHLHRALHTATSPTRSSCRRETT